MRVFVLLVAVIVIGFSSPSWAKGCYSSVEAEAENAIRIHSELMVIGLNCQHMTPRGWKNFYQQYREITNQHSDMLSGYEETLITHYRKAGASNAERKMHDLRTGFANEVSANIARMRPDIFCSTYSPRIPRVAGMSRGEFVQWIQTSTGGRNLSRPICH